MLVPETEIIVTKDGTELLRKTVRPGNYVIGRGPECEVRVDVELVARRHAQLTVHFDHVVIEDLGSSSGTFVNGEPIKTATRLWPNQKIQIGSARVELHRIKTVPPPNDSVAPQTAAVQRLLPEEFLRNKKYDIGKIVAQGGMGAILDARDATTERRVAMKVMLDGSSPDDLTRFVAEAKVTAQLEHPSIVPVYELSVDENGQVFYTMKMVRGITLRKVLEEIAAGMVETVQKYPLPVLLTIFQKVCDALAFAHSKGVIHRDLKPENIMLDDFGVVLVMDWGLAKVVGKSSQFSVLSSQSGDALVRANTEHCALGTEHSPPATLAGTVMGTPQYMSPEQARGEVEDLDVRSDIYALGAILYHLLALRPPVSGKDAWVIVRKVADGHVEPLTAPKNHPIPDSIAAVVRKAMAFARDERYPHVAGLQHDIGAYQNGRATKAENASLGKQLVLLVKRHKALFGTAFVAWLVITALAVWFVINVTHAKQQAENERNIAAHERDRATTNEQQAVRNAELAAKNAQEAKQNEQKAVERGEETRRALAKSQLALAEAAYREHDGVAMQTALEGVPENLRDLNWNYLLEHADNSIATLRTRSSRSIADVAAHPKKAGVFAIIAGDGSVAMVEAATGVRLLEFQSGFKEMKAGSFRLAVSPDGEKIAIGRSGEGGIVIHSTGDGKKLAEWISVPCDRLEFSPDGNGLLQTSRNANAVNLLDAATGHAVWSIKSDGPNVNAFGTFAPDGQTVLTFFNKEGIRLLSAKDGSVVRSYPQGGDMLAMSPDGARIFSMGSQGVVKCIENKDGGRVLYQFRADTGSAKGLACPADGRHIVTFGSLRSGKQSIQVWDAQTGALLQALMGGRGYGYRLGVHPLSPEIVLAGTTSKVWSLPAVQDKWTFSQVVYVTGSFWGTDDLLLTGRGGGGGVRLLDLGAAEPAKQPLWESAGKARYLVAVSADERFAAIAPQSAAPLDDASVQLLRLHGHTVELAGSIEAKGIVRHLLLSPDGALLFMDNASRATGKVFDRASGKPLAVFEKSGIHGINAVRWVGNTRLVTAVSIGAPRGATGSKEQLILWDAATGQQLKAVDCSSAVLSLAARPGAALFAEAGTDLLVRLRDAATLQVQRTFRAHDAAITALALHPSQPILVSASDDLTVKLWDLESGRCLEELRGPTGTPTRLEINPGGKRLACWADNVTRIWEPKSFNEKPEDKVDADGWENVLAELKPEAIAKTGHGWQWANGALLSPGAAQAVIPLPGDRAQSSYQVRMKLRQLAPKDVFAVVLPVADRQAAFNLDGFPAEGHFTGLARIDGHSSQTVPGALHGKQIHDSDQHELQLSVRLEGANVRVAATLDATPLYQWSGPVTALSLDPDWPTVPPGSLALGASGADWVVYGVKVKRLK